MKNKQTLMDSFSGNVSKFRVVIVTTSLEDTAVPPTAPQTWGVMLYIEQLNEVSSTAWQEAPLITASLFYI